MTTLFQKKVLSFAFMLCAALCANGQSTKLLTQVADQIQGLKSISYVLRFTEKSPFSEGEISTGQTQTAAVFLADGQLLYQHQQSSINTGQTAFQEIFTEGKHYSINLTDSTYTIAAPKTPMHNELQALASLLKEQLKSKPERIIQKKDTLFAGRKCYSFLIKSFDTLLNGNHDFTHRSILIDQKTRMPLYYKIVGQGSASKGGFALGRLHFYNENVFSDYQLNPAISMETIVPTGFTIPAATMLEKAATAPPLNIADLSGKTLGQENFSNKTLLVVFGSTACPANPLANPMLNRLQSQFQTPAFAIVNIYTSETADQVKKYISSNNLHFPIYLANRKLSKDYQIQGTPNFYLINKDGKIALAEDGYSATLEAKLSEKITALLATEK